jgi:hypothetical protein
MSYKHTTIIWATVRQQVVGRSQTIKAAARYTYDAAHLEVWR